MKMEITKNGAGFFLHCGDNWCWEMHLDLKSMGCIALEKTNFQVFDDNIERVKEYIKNYHLEKVKKELREIEATLRRLDDQRRKYLSKKAKLNEELRKLEGGKVVTKQFAGCGICEIR